LSRYTLFVALLGWAVASHGAPSKKKPASVRQPQGHSKTSVAKQPKSKKGVESAIAPRRLPAEEVPAQASETPEPSPMYSNPTRFKREFESGFGQMVLHEPAVVYSAQTRFALGTQLPLYVGADLQFALFSPGYFFSLMPGIWYDFVLRSVPAATLSLGVLAGPAFGHRLAGISNNLFAAFGEASVAFEIDDLSTVRGHFRPGIVGGRVAFVMTMLIGFRFR
jgi:hypothetical protein